MFMLQVYLWALKEAQKVDESVSSFLILDQEKWQVQKIANVLLHVLEWLV